MSDTSTVTTNFNLLKQFMDLIPEARWQESRSVKLDGHEPSKNLSTALSMLVNHDQVLWMGDMAQGHTSPNQVIGLVDEPLDGKDMAIQHIRHKLLAKALGPALVGYNTVHKEKAGVAIIDLQSPELAAHLQQAIAWAPEHATDFVDAELKLAESSLIKDVAGRLTRISERDKTELLKDIAVALNAEGASITGEDGTQHVVDSAALAARKWPRAASPNEEENTPRGMMFLIANRLGKQPALELSSKMELLAELANALQCKHVTLANQHNDMKTTVSYRKGGEFMRPSWRVRQGAGFTCP